MKVVVDTTAVIAVITDEPLKPRILQLTSSASLHAPASLPWEVGNAFSAMFKQNRITAAQSAQALDLFARMPINLEHISLGGAVALAAALQIYAYDAYMIECARLAGAPLLTLDGGLLHAARRAGVALLEVRP